MSNIAVHFELNIRGLNEVMKSAGMKSYLQDVAGQVSTTAGNGYGSDVKTASYEAIAKIYPSSAGAAKDNSENNTLLRSLQAVGLPMSKN